MKSKTALFITESAAIAALYVVLTMAFAPISFGQSGIDVRIAEALVILPYFTPAAIPGLAVGCVIANVIGGGIIWDIIFGSCATLIGAVIGYLLRTNRWLVPIPAVAANTLIIPFILYYGYGVNLPIPMLMLSVGVGEFISAFVLGEILLTALAPRKKFIFRSVSE